MKKYGNNRTGQAELTSRKNTDSQDWAKVKLKREGKISVNSFGQRQKSKTRTPTYTQSKQVSHQHTGSFKRNEHRRI